METRHITNDDLQRFRKQLINDLKSLLAQAAVKDLKPWLKTHEVCRLLKVSPGTLQHLRDTGKIKFSKVGGIIFYCRSDIDQLMEINATNSDFNVK